MAKNDNAKICSILAYWLIGIIWYFVDEQMKKDNAVKFHVKQGLVLLIGWVIIQILSSFMGFWMLWRFIWILQLALFVLAIIGTLNAVNGKQTPLPVVGGLAKSFTF